MNIKRLSLTVCLFALTLTLMAQKVNIVIGKQASQRELYAKEYLTKKLTQMGYTVTDKKGTKITLLNTGSGPAEGFSITNDRKGLTVQGNDASGVIYGCVELAERIKLLGKPDNGAKKKGLTPNLPSLSSLLSPLSSLLSPPSNITSSPQMVMRGTCIGLQKTEYLPGHGVYEYPYTPENFPWFYDKEQWIEYLDMMVENRFNSLYLWNGHPFASLVKLPDYPFALEVDEETFKKNEEMFSFLTTEADKRGIWVIQMFYNIILSKPFADHYGLKTQDRHRPITPLISDYTRKSIAAFIEKYPHVGLLVCLGEAMATIDDDVTWMKETIIPGVMDGLKRTAGNGEGSADGALPPIVLRAHDTDGPRVLGESLPLYPNIYTMSKYTGESLTPYEPGGPWGETHRELAAAAPGHIDNVHILANLEPWRWSSPAFVEKTVRAMHDVHHSKGLHLYPQASYWDWPYTADKLSDDTTSVRDEQGRPRLKQLDRDWMWYKVWGRYAWNCDYPYTTIPDDSPSASTDRAYWTAVLADYYGIDTLAASHLLNAYDESGEIAPKLLRRFGITEGNRQTLLLGMTMGQLVNPYKYTIYPGFYESCGPQGEKLIEYVEKEWKGEEHVGELPLDIVDQCVSHGQKAVEEMMKITATPTRHADEFERIRNDMTNYLCFAAAFYDKVLAAQQVLNYKWTKDIKYLDAAVPLLEKSQQMWHQLALSTDKHYLYANSMQTAQRRIPVGGDNGKMKTWSELEKVYQAELDAFKENIAQLKNPVSSSASSNIIAAKPAKVKIFSPLTSDGTSLAPHLVPLQKGAILFENRPDTPVDSLAAELVGMQALVLNRDTTRIVGTTIEYESTTPVRLLVGLFKDDDPKFAKAPKLEIDATGNEYGQAEPILTNAISIVQMPKVNIHQYLLPAGRNTIRLPKGILMVAGFTTSDIKPRDCGLNGPSNEVDWLFQR